MIPVAAIVGGTLLRTVGGAAARAIGGKAVQSLGGAAVRDVAANAISKGSSIAGTGMMMGNFSSGSNDGKKEDVGISNIY